MKDIREMLLVAGLFMLVSVIPVGIWHVFYFLGEYIRLALWGGYYLVFTAAMAENFLRKRGLAWSYIGVSRSINLRRAVVFGMAFAVLSVSVGWLAAEFAGLRPSADSGLVKLVMEKLAEGREGNVFLALFMLPVALCEELVFRGIILGGLEKRRGFLFALPVSSMLFGLVHGTPGGMLVAALYGAAWGLAYKLGGGIAAPVVAHYLHNVASCHF